MFLGRSIFPFIIQLFFFYNLCSTSLVLFSFLSFLYLYIRIQDIIVEFYRLTCVRFNYREILIGGNSHDFGDSIPT